MRALGAGLVHELCDAPIRDIEQFESLNMKDIGDLPHWYTFGIACPNTFQNECNTCANATRARDECGKSSETIAFLHGNPVTCISISQFFPENLQQLMCTEPMIYFAYERDNQPAFTLRKK
eukprot:UN23866